MSTVSNPMPEPAFRLLEVSAVRKGPVPLVVREAAGEGRLVFASDPGGMAAEQYRVVRRRLMEKYPQGAVVLVTSPKPGDGKTVTSANMAWCMAEGGSPTLLAEMDLRKPSIAKLLGYTCEGSGIDTVLAAGAEPESVLRQVNKMQLHVAAAGRARSNPIGLLSGENMGKFLKWAREKYRWVVLDSPPLFPLADSLELSSFSDFTLMVVRARSTPKTLVERAIELLGPRLQHVLMNESSHCADSSYRYVAKYYPYENNSQ